MRVVVDRDPRLAHRPEPYRPLPAARDVLLPPPAAVRAAYEQAAQWFVERVAAVEVDQWSEAGLGVWTVRELVAHGARSFSLVGQYLDAAGPGTEVAADGALTYWTTLRAYIESTGDETLAAYVAQRGRDDARAMGDDPVAHVWALADATLNRLATTPDDAPCTTSWGSFRLIDYLPSRVVELVVHGLDLCRATGQPRVVPDDPLRLAAAMLVAAADPVRLVLALTGRDAYAVLA